MKEIKEHLSLDNLTIGQLEDIAKIMNSTSDNSPEKVIDKIISILEYFNIDEDIIDNLNTKDIAEIGKLLSSEKSISLKEDIMNTITINNKTYTAPEYDDFVLKGRIIGKLASKSTSFNFPSYCIACIFLDDDLTKTEHLDDSHIKYKQSLFRDLKVKHYYGYIVKVQSQYIESTVEILNENKESDEQTNME